MIVDPFELAIRTRRHAGRDIAFVHVHAVGLDLSPTGARQAAHKLLELADRAEKLRHPTLPASPPSSLPGHDASTPRTDKP